jgi:hypothetical protein
MTNDNPNGLTSADLAMFAALGIPAELVAAAGVKRVDNGGAQEHGFSRPGDLSGLVFPYIDPATGRTVTYRLRRDHPEMEGGKPKDKYLSAYRDRRHAYFPPGAGELVRDPTVLIVLVEAEKSALALTALAARKGRKLLAIGLGGAWGFRGRLGKVEGPNGERVDEKGLLPELRALARREVVVMLDANAASNPNVKRARAALVAELLAMNSRARIAPIPSVEGANGPDDLIAVCGDDITISLLDDAPLAAEVAVNDARSAISAIDNNRHDAEAVRAALDAVAAVPDRLQREMLESELAATVRGKVTKKTIQDELKDRSDLREKVNALVMGEARKAELLSRPVNPAQLIHDLENFFAERARLPEGAALILACFTVLTYVFDVFDTVAYVLLESAIKRCGKNTVMRLLEYLCSKALHVTALTEAIFRLIDQQRPTLLINECEELNNRRSDRTKALLPVLLEGYKKGSPDPQVRWQGQG